MISQDQLGTVNNFEVITFPAYNPAAGCNHSVCNHAKILCSTEAALQWGVHMLTLYYHKKALQCSKDLPSCHTHKALLPSFMGPF
jgi:hypothetical protein